MIRFSALCRLAPRVPPLFAGEAANWFAPLLVALIVYVASLAGIGLILVDETLRASENLLSGRLTVQIPADASAARVETILAVLRQTPGVGSVHLLTPSETSRLLEPWLGSPVPLEEFPVPRLIDVGLDPAAAIDLAKLGTHCVDCTRNPARRLQRGGQRAARPDPSDTGPARSGNRGRAAARCRIGRVRDRRGGRGPAIGYRAAASRRRRRPADRMAVCAALR